MKNLILFATVLFSLNSFASRPYAYCPKLFKMVDEMVELGGELKGQLKDCPYHEIKFGEDILKYNVVRSCIPEEAADYIRQLYGIEELPYPCKH